MFDLLLRWGLPVLLLGVFGLCAWANLDNLFEFTAQARQRKIPAGTRVSPAMWVGGIAGAIALWYWPQPDLRWLCWLPFLIDFPGTLGIGRAGNHPAADEGADGQVRPPGST
jgi:hypothetical protein